MRTMVLIGLLCVAGCCCNKDRKPSTTQPAGQGMTALSPGNHPVIVHVVSRQTRVSISSGPAGLMYSMSQSDGTLLVADVPAAEFEQMEPELYRHIRRYIAVEADAGAAVGWAGM